MKKIVYAVLATLSGLVLLFSYRTSHIDEIAPAAANTSSTGTADSGSGAASTTTSSGLNDGTFTGSPANTRFGPVQVQITVSGGVITDVQVPEYPSTDPRDRQINARALPTLVSETTTAQSAEIDMVSGATYTSQGYLTSLQSALDLARS